MSNGKNLAVFINGLNTYQLIHQTPYLDFYNGWFSDKTEDLKEEVQEELLLLPKEKQSDYLLLVKQKLDRYNIFNDDPSLFLNKWIEKYELEGLEFPFTKNPEMREILSSSAAGEPKYERKKEINNMQMDFFCYSASLEYLNALAFIDNLLDKEEKTELTQTDATTLEVPSEEVIEYPVATPVELPESEPKQIEERWYALHYLLEQKSLDLKLPVTREGAFKKSEIEKIGKERSGRSGQGFYRQILKHIDNISNATSIERSFGKDWKQHVIEVSKDDAAFAKFLDENY